MSFEAITADEARDIGSTRERVENLIKMLDRRIRDAAEKEEHTVPLKFMCDPEGLSPVGKRAVAHFQGRGFRLTYAETDLYGKAPALTWEPVDLSPQASPRPSYARRPISVRRL